MYLVQRTIRTLSLPKREHLLILSETRLPLQVQNIASESSARRGFKSTCCPLVTDKLFFAVFWQEILI